MRVAVAVKQQDKGFAAYIPGLPGCNSQGTSKEEAVRNIRAVLLQYLEALKLDIVVEESPDGPSRGFVANVQLLPGCVAYGLTRDEAVRNLRPAIVRYLEGDEDHPLWYGSDKEEIQL